MGITRRSHAILDTGWRVIVSKTAGSQYIALRRVGNVVHVQYRGLTYAETKWDSGTYKAVIPTGFIPDAGYTKPRWIAGDATANTTILAGTTIDGSSQHVLWIAYRVLIDNVMFYYDAQYLTADPWPAPLPGTAV
jgi:hypothetical protein